MSDEWAFWRAQLAGEEPETTPGTPHAGYYTMRRRYTIDNPSPGVGKPRKKIMHEDRVIAIWRETDGWHCVETGESGPRHMTDVEQIDGLFSRCCRNAIPHERYQELTQEKAA